MNKESIENISSYVLMVFGFILALNIFLKVFEFSFFPTQVIYFIASIIKAPFAIFIPDPKGSFDFEAFAAMLGYLILYYVVVFVSDRVLGMMKERSGEIKEDIPEPI